MECVPVQHLREHVAPVPQECTSRTPASHHVMIVGKVIINVQLDSHPASRARPVASRIRLMQRASPLARCARKDSISHIMVDLDVTIVAQGIINRGLVSCRVSRAQLERPARQRVLSWQVPAKNVRPERMARTQVGRSAMRAAQTTISRTVVVQAASAARLESALASRVPSKHHSVRIVRSVKVFRYLCVCGNFSKALAPDVVFASTPPIDGRMKFYPCLVDEN